MRRSRKPEPPHAAIEEVSPRSVRRDPRTDPEDWPRSEPIRRISGPIPVTREPARQSGPAPRQSPAATRSSAPAPRQSAPASSAPPGSNVEMERLARSAAEVASLGVRVLQLEEALTERTRAEEALRETSNAQARHITALEHHALLHEQTIIDLERRLAAKDVREADLERLVSGTITEKELLRSKVEEIEALHLAVDCARAENRALQARLTAERAKNSRNSGEK